MRAPPPKHCLHEHRTYRPVVILLKARRRLSSSLLLSSSVTHAAFAGRVWEATASSASIPPSDCADPGWATPTELSQCENTTRLLQLQGDLGLCGKSAWPNVRVPSTPCATLWVI